MMINYTEKHSSGNCAGCHKVDAPAGQCLCDACGEEAESYFGMSKEEEAEMWAEMAREERRQRWKALRALFTPACMERGFTSRWKDARARLRCAVCLIIGRMHKDGDGTRGYEYETLAAWDHKKEYAGWSGMFVSVHEKQWRAEVYRDGEWNM